MKLKEDVPPLFLHVFRSVVWVYSFITFIPWYFLSGAGANQTRAKRIKAHSVSSAIPAGSGGLAHLHQTLVHCLHSNLTPSADQNNWSKILNYIWF